MFFFQVNFKISSKADPSEKEVRYAFDRPVKIGNTFIVDTPIVVKASAYPKYGQSLMSQCTALMPYYCRGDTPDDRRNGKIAMMMFGALLGATFIASLLGY